MNVNEVSAIVVTFRSRLLIDQCLQSLQEAGVQHIWVVDNASDDGTADYVQQNYPGIHLIRSEKNLGFAAGNNLALGQIQSEAVLLLNPDAWLTPNALNLMLSTLSAETNVGMVGPSIDRQGQTEPSLLQAPSAFASWLFLLSGMRAFGTGGFSGKEVEGFPWCSVTEGDHLRGSCMLVRLQAIRDVGLLDESFFLYFEETEWCMRFRQKGWRILIEPAALVHHVGKASVQTQESLPSLEYMRSGVLFWMKIYPWVIQWILRGTLWMMACMKYVLLLLFRPASVEQKGWLSNVVALAIHPYKLPIVYDRAKRPSSWPEP